MRARAGGTYPRNLPGFVIPEPVVYENHAQDSRVKECDISPQINAKAGTGGGNLPLALYSIMPQNSGKDYKAREVEVTQPLMAAGPGSGDQGGDVVVFKPAHYTRGKDGAHSDVHPPITAEQDRGDTHPVIFESRFARNGRGAPDEVCPPLKAQSGQTGKGDGAPIVAFGSKDSGADASLDVAPTLRAGGHADSHANAGVPPAVCFTQNSRSEVREIGGDGQITGALAGEPGAQQQNYVARAAVVRRLTPKECERLQGFPDDYTLVPWRGKDAPDGHRYKACGNSMAVPVMRWLARRIELVENNP